MDGLQRSADGEFAAQVYVISSKIKKKIKSFNNKQIGEKEKERLCNKVERWNNTRCFIFHEKYIDDTKVWEKISCSRLKQAIAYLDSIKMSVIKNSI
jgi:hypothetical protein